MDGTTPLLGGAKLFVRTEVDGFLVLDSLSCFGSGSCSDQYYVFLALGNNAAADMAVQRRVLQTTSSNIPR